jgi:Rrf2 family protein
LHCAALIGQLPAGVVISRRALAEHFGLPEAYLAKQLQAMVRAEILVANSGPSGGFGLARPAGQITALEILEAIDGTAPPFVCQEIRQQGSGAAPAKDCRTPCAISLMLASAHRAWRESLRGISLDQLVAAVPPKLQARNRLLFGGKSQPSSPPAAMSPRGSADRS